jgi:hypothetical protein
MPRSKTFKKKTHRRRRRGGGLMDYLPSWLGGPSDTSASAPAPAPIPAPSLAPTPPASLPPLGGKSRRRRR